MSAILDWIELHPGVASWGQAIVGLLAILTALGIAILEGRRANQATLKAWVREDARQGRQELRELERLDILRHSAAALLALAQRRVQVASELIRRNTKGDLIQMCRTHQSDLSSMESQLLAFPNYELGDMRATDIIAQALVALRGARTFLDYQVIELGKHYEDRHEKVADILVEVATHLAEMLQLFEVTIERRQRSALGEAAAPSG